MLWFVFVPIVVVLENTWGKEALKRSKNLGKDFYLRTLGLIVIIMCISALFGGIAHAALANFITGFYFHALLLNAIQILVQPLTLIMIVLSYYDLRVRKEAYDIATLAEDLQH